MNSTHAITFQRNDNDTFPENSNIIIDETLKSN